MASASSSSMEAAASGADSSAEWQQRGRQPEVEDYLLQHHLRRFSWHTVLNNHASTRPRDRGGPLVKAVTDCKEFAKADRGSSEQWRCTLTLPNSFEKEDGRVLVTRGEGLSTDAASEQACLRAVASLISQSPGQFVLRPPHWDVTLEELVGHLPGDDPASGGHRPLPVHTRARLQGAGEEVDAADADARLVALVRDCLFQNDGDFDPSRISH